MKKAVSTATTSRSTNRWPAAGVVAELKNSRCGRVESHDCTPSPRRSACSRRLASVPWAPWTASERCTDRLTDPKKSSRSPSTSAGGDRDAGDLDADDQQGRAGPAQEGRQPGEQRCVQPRHDPGEDDDPDDVEQRRRGACERDRRADEHRGPEHGHQERALRVSWRSRPRRWSGRRGRAGAWGRSSLARGFDDGPRPRGGRRHRGTGRLTLGVGGPNRAGPLAAAEAPSARRRPHVSGERREDVGGDEPERRPRVVRRAAAAERVQGEQSELADVVDGLLGREHAVRAGLGAQRVDRRARPTCSRQSVPPSHDAYIRASWSMCGPYARPALVDVLGDEQARGRTARRG